MDGGPASGMYPPPGWVNTVTPNFATTNCGSVVQSQDWTTDGAAVLRIGFDSPSTWTTANWIPQDISGYDWACETAGIYNVSASQTLTLFNASDATNPIVNITLTVTSETTSEFNTVFQASVAVPITIDPIVYNVSVGGLANVDPGSTMALTVQSLSGNITCTSGAAVLGNPFSKLCWNLVAQGNYGNVGLVI